MVQQEVPEGEEAGEEERPLELDALSCPEYVVVIEAPESACKQRLMAMEQEQVHDTHNEEAGFHRRWQRYAAENLAADDTKRLSDFFSGVDVSAFAPVSDEEVNEQGLYDKCRLYVEEKGR